MTLIVTVNGPDSIWLLADRRLSFAGRPPKDDARKITFVETKVGVAILGYAGLGATALGTEPADWMSAVLRGRRLSLEHSLGTIAEAMKVQFPRHLGQYVPAHSVMVPAFVEGEARFYGIHMARAKDGSGETHVYTRYGAEHSPAPPRVCMGGSGAQYLPNERFWMRSLLRIVRAHDRGNATPRSVADSLANLNDQVYLAAKDRSVGPRCIVAWRLKKGGGGHLSYTRLQRDSQTEALPSIGNGMDISALIGVVGPSMMQQANALLRGEPAPEIDEEKINKELARLPEGPDERLR